MSSIHTNLMTKIDQKFKHDSKGAKLKPVCENFSKIDKSNIF